MKQVVIIGAGVIGCSIALHLGRLGYHTVNLDKNSDAGAGSTSNSCAIVRFSYSTLEGVMLAREGCHYWSDWPRFIGVRDDRGMAPFVRCGHLMLRIHPEDRASLLEHYRVLGVPFELWDNAKIRTRLPVMSTLSFYPPRPISDESFWLEPAAQIAGGVFTPEAGYIADPKLATHNLQCAAEASGGRFVFRKRVVAIERSGTRVTGVGLDDGSRLDADVLVNAAGPYSSRINQLAGVEAEMAIRTRALRREVHHLSAPQGFDFEHRGIMTSDADLGIYFRPGGGNSITLGSGDPACDPKTWIDDPDHCPGEITEQQWTSQVYRLARRLPDVQIPHRASGVVDMYDVSDDWIPIYDRSDLGGFYMAIGTSGHQFKNAGAVGALMAGLIEACEAGLDHDAHPYQHRLTYTGRVLNTGVFSRLRARNASSSYSVRG